MLTTTILLVAVACSSGLPFPAVIEMPQSILSARERMAGAADGDLFVVAGGQVGDKPAISPADGGALFDGTAQAWEPLPSHPLLRRRGMMATIRAGQLLLWGGEDPCGMAACPSSPDGAVLDLDSGRWTDLPTDLDRGLSDGKGVWSCDRLYVGGGSEGQGLARVTTLFRMSGGLGGGSAKWTSQELETPIYDLVGGPRVVTLLTGPDEDDRLTVTEVDGCSGDVLRTWTVPESENADGGWVAVRGDAFWVGYVAGNRAVVAEHGGTDWRRIASFDVSDMPMPYTGRDLRRGWTDLDGDVVLAVTPLGWWAFNVRTHDLTRPEPDRCTPGAAVARMREHVVVWGGQTCGSAAGLSASGLLISSR